MRLKSHRTQNMIEIFNLFPLIDKRSWFYKNCKRQRKNNAKICQVCPFRNGIEEQENVPTKIS